MKAPLLPKILSAATLALACLSSPASAGNYTGYMNVFFNNSGSQGGYIFGSNWGVSDLKTTVLTSNNGTMIGDQLRLQPNYNTYADSLAAGNGDRAFWTNSTDGGVTAGPDGNKWLVARTYVETTSISLTNYTLEGIVNSNDLNTTLYSAQAFIDVLDPLAGYATVLSQSTPLPSTGSFSVNADLTAHQGKLLQVGFMMSGVNANPVNEASFGGVTVSVVPEPSTYALLMLGAAGLAYRSVRRRRR